MGDHNLVLLLQHNVSTDRAVPGQGAPLNFALTMGHIDMAHLLLDFGAGWNSRDYPALHAAINGMHWGIIERLLSVQGFSVWQEDSDGDSALAAALAQIHPRWLTR